MQELKVPTLFHRAIDGKRCWSVIALSVMLTACQAPHTESAAMLEPPAASAPAAAGTAAVAMRPARL